jgi:hypothetical protein
MSGSNLIIAACHPWRLLKSLAVCRANLRYARRDSIRGIKSYNRSLPSWRLLKSLAVCGANLRCARRDSIRGIKTYNRSLLV